MMERFFIFNGEKIQSAEFNIDSIIGNLKARTEYMHNLRIEDIIGFFDELVLRWENTGLIKKHGYLKNLSEFFEKKNLSNSLKIALHGNYNSLDKFVDLGDPKLLLHAQPRGLTVHWLAGNVPVLGLFSIFLSLATKNTCLVKAAFNGHQELVELLDTLNQVKTEKIDGKEFAKSVFVVLLNNDDKEMHEKISLAANLRIAWGGQEAMNAIIGLKKNIFCEDIIFGPKYSYAIIDKESLSSRFKELAQKFAVDVSVFDQYACSSPHTLFIQEEKSGQALEFCKELAKNLKFVNRLLLPKAKVDTAKAAEIISLRGEYELKSQIFSSAGTEWTVVYTKEPGLAKGCFSRVIFVKPIKDLAEIKDYNDRHKQTLGLAFTMENKLKHIDAITRKGIDRCPNFGLMTFYESPWDGMFVFDRLVRWVSLHKNEN